MENQFSQFQLSSDGRSLTILNLKPEISGFYQAQIDYGYGSIDSTFVYDVQIPGEKICLIGQF